MVLSDSSVAWIRGMAQAPVLPEPVSARPHDVFAGDNVGNGLFLDGRHVFVAHLVECSEYVGC